MATISMARIQHDDIVCDVRADGRIVALPCVVVAVMFVRELVLLHVVSTGADAWYACARRIVTLLVRELVLLHAVRVDVFSNAGIGS